MKAIDAHVGMKVIRTGNPLHNHPVGQIATIKTVHKNGDWFEFEEFKQKWMSKYWEPHIEDVQEPFPVGSRVRVITKEFINQFGDEGILIPYDEPWGNFIYKVRFDNGELDNVYRLGDLELIKEADMPVENDKKPFKNGDRIVFNDRIREDWWFKPGQHGVIDRVTEDKLYPLKIIVDNHPNKVANVSFDMIEPEEKAVVKAPLTRFVFASRGGKYYEKGDFNSLEAALVRANNLRGAYQNMDIHPFVIVEE